METVVGYIPYPIRRLHIKYVRQRVKAETKRFTDREDRYNRIFRIGSFVFLRVSFSKFRVLRYFPVLSILPKITRRR